MLQLPSQYHGPGRSRVTYDLSKYTLEEDRRDCDGVGKDRFDNLSFLTRRDLDFPDECLEPRLGCRWWRIGISNTLPAKRSAGSHQSSNIAHISTRLLPSSPSSPRLRSASSTTLPCEMKKSCWLTYIWTQLAPPLKSCNVLAQCYLSARVSSTKARLTAIILGSPFL